MNNVEEKIGFDKIKELVAAECSNAMASMMARQMSFMTRHEEIKAELSLTEEMRNIVLMESGFPSQDFDDMSAVLTDLRVANTVIPQEQLPTLKSSLHTLCDCLSFLLRDESEQYPNLRAAAGDIASPALIVKRIDKLVDDKGEIYDDASDQLRDTRRMMVRKRGDIDTQIVKTLNHSKQEGWSPQNAEPTIRNGRLVIPMLDTHRRKIKGLIHDESATRQTAYLEPAEVVELNNDLRELEFAEQREIQKILLQFSDMLRPELDNLLDAYRFLARLDFLRAKARFAIMIEACVPLVDDDVKIEWLSARHPLLYLSYAKAAYEAVNSTERIAPRHVVPFNITLNQNARILIVSGPNAGGKSVCLKAVGLIQYMLQSGMPVPVNPTSIFGIFDDIFIDIGDQQSIENDLSTYTSHLQNMTQLLQQAGSHTLFLLDELGGGTEPRSGCAIAEAVLEELHERGSYGVVTTHFADLKLLADKLPAVVNGAMLFDTEKMQPLYRLSIGRPGSSFAFEIASNVGFPAKVLEAAASKVGGQMLNFEHQLQQIELDKQEISRQRTELELSDNFLHEVIQKYQALNEQLETRRHAIVSEARQEAKRILADANRTVEQTISDIKSAQAEKERTRQARAMLNEASEKIEADQRHSDAKLKEALERSPAAANDDEQVELDTTPIVKGDIVSIAGQNTFAQVVEVKGKKAVVESRSMRMTIPLDQLQKTKKKSIPAVRQPRSDNRFQSIYDDLNKKRLAFNPTLDIRGMRADEAIDSLQRFLDDATLLGEHEVRVLHGKGYGILLSVVRQQLQHNTNVAQFHSERLELGGEGITVVHLK